MIDIPKLANDAADLLHKTNAEEFTVIGLVDGAWFCRSKHRLTDEQMLLVDKFIKEFSR